MSSHSHSITVQETIILKIVSRWMTNNKWPGRAFWRKRLLPGAQPTVACLSPPGCVQSTLQPLGSKNSTLKQSWTAFQLSCKAAAILGCHPALKYGCQLWRIGVQRARLSARHGYHLFDCFFLVTPQDPWLKTFSETVMKKFCQSHRCCKKQLKVVRWKLDI